MVDTHLRSVPQGGLPMRPPLWPPPVELSTAEHAIIKRIRRATLFIFLRHHRHTLLADPLQQELATLSKDQPQGHPPVPPAQLALATLLQASTQVSDDEVIEGHDHGSALAHGAGWSRRRDAALQHRHPGRL